MIVQALAHSASITVCEVVPSQPKAIDAMGVVERVHELRWSLAFQRLRQICERFSEHMEIDYGVFAGEPFIAITEQVIEQGFDLVVHISKQDDAGPAAGLNATGMHLMRKCPCAVWAIHPNLRRAEEPGADSLPDTDTLVAIDRDHGPLAARADTFAQRVLAIAADYAIARGGRLHVMHAWQPFGHELLEHPSLKLDEKGREFYRSQQRVETQTWFDETLKSLADSLPAKVELAPVLRCQEPVSAVLEALDETNAGLMVLGNVGSSRHPGVLIGPTTESLLAQCNVPTLALKPDDYITPLLRPAG
ncbi:MAG: universal stress protein [Pseudomonadota bacterium]